MGGKVSEKKSLMKSRKKVDDKTKHWRTLLSIVLKGEQ